MYKYHSWELTIMAKKLDVNSGTARGLGYEVLSENGSPKEVIIESSPDEKITKNDINTILNWTFKHLPANYFRDRIGDGIKTRKPKFEGPVLKFVIRPKDH